MSIQNPFRVGITRDFLDNAGTLAYGDIGLDVLKSNPRVVAEFLPDYGASLPASVGRDFDALLVLAPRVTAETVSTADRLTVSHGLVSAMTVSTSRHARMPTSFSRSLRTACGVPWPHLPSPYCWV